MMENEGRLPSTPSAASYTDPIPTGIATVSMSNVEIDILQGPLNGLREEPDLESAPNRPTFPTTMLDRGKPTVEDYDEDDDTSTSSHRTIVPSGDPRRSWFSLRNLPTLTLVQRNVLKCSVAYFIASLFTFSPVLSHFIGDLTSYGAGAKGPSPSAHMVATMYVLAIANVVFIRYTSLFLIVLFTLIPPKPLVL
jgi:hypothetical protein